MISTGKIIGGGFPAGALGGRAEILRAFDPTPTGTVMWGGTFTANPVTMTAGLAALQLFDHAAISELNAQGDRLRNELTASGVRVNGSGSLIRVMPADTNALWWALYKRGVLAGSNGLLALSTAMNDEQLTLVKKATIDAAQSVETEHRLDGLQRTPQ